ncbi:MAG: GNAT family N-acetyltransferase [Acidobacteriota bacterium]
MVTVESISSSRNDLAALLAGTSNAPYPLDMVIREKLDRPGVDGAAEVLGAIEEGRLVGAVVRCGRFVRLIGVASSARRRGLGRTLMAAVESRAAASGETNVVIAAEPGNYFTPGVWTEDAGSLAFFDSLGYSRPARAVNLRADLGFLETQGPDAGTGSRIRRPNIGERVRVANYIREEFGRSWCFEADFAFEHPLPSMFIAEEGSEIVGFSAHLANNAGLPWYGPTGVSSAARGRGFGRGLLLASLRDMKVRGFGEAIIAWAAALDFYKRACGASPAARFVILEKNL